MKIKSYNLLLILVLIIASGAVFSFVSAQSTLISYPEIEGAGISVAFNMSLPNLIKYIYLFAVGICGAIALAAILLGAIKYIGAAGNSSKIADAKEQIISALLGVVILLSSYLLLYTINPDLVRLGLTLPKIDTSKIVTGEDVYRCICQCFYYPTTGSQATKPEPIYKDVIFKPQIIPSNLPAQKWGPLECRLESSYVAWLDCKQSCEASVTTDGLITGCDKYVGLKNFSIKSASLDADDACED